MDPHTNPMSREFEKRFEDHMANDERSFDRIATAVETLVDTDRQFLIVLERIGKIETNVAWLMKWFWAVMTPMAATLVGAVIALILINKK